MAGAGAHFRRPVHRIAIDVQDLEKCLFRVAGLERHPGRAEELDVFRIHHLALLADGGGIDDAPEAIDLQAGDFGGVLDRVELPGELFLHIFHKVAEDGVRLLESGGDRLQAMAVVQHVVDQARPADVFRAKAAVLAAQEAGIPPAQQALRRLARSQRDIIQ